MKKKSFWSKIAGLFLFVGASFAITACQTTNKSDARILDNQCEVAIYTEEGSGQRYAQVTLAVDNNSIYDVIEWDITYYARKGETPEPEVTTTVYMPIKHGAKGYVVFVEKDVPSDVTGYKITATKAKTFLNLWQTYIAWWITGIVVVAISSIFYIATIFAKGITVSEAMDRFKSNIASSIMVFAFAFIICMFPLFLGNWVPTIILLVSLSISIVVAALATWIRTLTLK